MAAEHRPREHGDLDNRRPHIDASHDAGARLGRPLNSGVWNRTHNRDSGHVVERCDDCQYIGGWRDQKSADPLSGDIAGAFIIASVTCSQTSPLTIVLHGEAGGHRGALTITQRSTAGNIDVAYLPDGVGGPQYLANHIPASGRDSRGFVTFNAAGLARSMSRCHSSPGARAASTGRP